MKTTAWVLGGVAAACLLAAWPGASGASGALPSTAAVAPAAQLTPPATIRVKHDPRNTFWPDWPAGEIRVFPLDEYVAHVCHMEISDSSPFAALQAQSVAARTYAWYYINHPPAPDYDITDWSPYQAMRPGPHPNCDRAAQSTSGQYVAYSGGPIYAMYSAENGNPTLDNTWNNSYLRGVEDPVGFGFAREGHGLGMSQRGARRWASLFGWNYQQILMHYYTGVSIELPATPLPDTAPPLGSIVFPWSSWYFTGSRMLLRSNASDGASGVAHVDFSARFSNGVTTTIGSDASAVGGWTAAWDVSTVPDQPLAAPLVLSMTIVDGAGHSAGGAPAHIGLDRTPPTVTAALDPAYSGAPTVTLRLSGDDSGSGLAAMAFSNDWLWEGEDLPAWTGGVVSDSAALNGSAWRARAGIDPPQKVYGPFTAALPVGQYRAYFRLKTTSPLTTAVIARLDVITSSGSITGIIGLHDVRGGDFRAGGQYQEMAVEFDHRDSSQQLEFRTHFAGVADLYLDRVLIVSYPQPFATSAAWVLRADAPQRVLRVKALDAAGNVSDDVVIVLPAQPPPATATPTPTASITPTPTSSAPAGTKTPTPTATASTPAVMQRVHLPLILSAGAATPTSTATPPRVCRVEVAGVFATGSEPHGIAVAPGRIYVANFTGMWQPGTVSVLDSLSGQPLAAPIAVGLAPNGVAYNAANGMLYVANRDSNSVSVIDTATLRVAATLPVGAQPNGVALDSATNRVYVANWGSNDISVIDAASNRVLGQRISVGSQPAMIAANAALGRVYVTNHGASTLTIIRSADNTAERTIGLADVPSPYGVAADTQTGRVYVASIVGGRMAILDGVTGERLGTTAPAPGLALWQAATLPASGLALVTSSLGSGAVYVYDTVQGQWLAGVIALGGSPEQGIAADDQNGRIYIANAGSDTVTAIQARCQ